VARLLTLALVAFAFSVGQATAAPTLTKTQAFQRARACLLKHGAFFVGRRPDGGGYATFTQHRGSTFWTYKTTLGQVASVTVFYAGRPGPNKALKASTERCLLDGV
jgi:hypothetical protein